MKFMILFFFAISCAALVSAGKREFKLELKEAFKECSLENSSEPSNPEEPVKPEKPVKPEEPAEPTEPIPQLSRLTQDNNDTVKHGHHGHHSGHHHDGHHLRGHRNESRQQYKAEKAKKIRCVVTVLGIMSENGQVDLEAFKAKFQEIFKVSEEQERLLADCAKEMATPEETAENILKCFKHAGRDPHHHSHRHRRH